MVEFSTIQVTETDGTKFYIRIRGLNRILDPKSTFREENRGQMVYFHIIYTWINDTIFILLTIHVYIIAQIILNCKYR